MEVKPCRVCGATNRGPGGKCRDCARAREERKRREVGIQKLSKYVGPCKKCGSSDLRKDGTCRPCAIAYSSEYYKKNKEKMNAYSSEYSKANRKKVNAINREWRKNNPEKSKSYGKAWREKNPEKSAEIKARWIRENKDRKRILTMNRRRKLSSGELSKTIVQTLKAKQKGKCAACKSDLIDFHVDHVMPIALGGSNTNDNVQLLCKKCNLTKSYRHPIDFMQSLGYLL